MEKKAQIQMGENVIILFIFFILLIFAVVFFTKLQSAKVQQTKDIDVTGRGLEIAQKVALLPELQCTKDNAEIFPGCYDEFNLRAIDSLAQEGENTEYYIDLFGFSTISIRKIFPSQQDPLLVYNRTKDDYESIIVTNTPITLCNFLTTSSDKGDCSFAVVRIEVYT
jgi:hypothetical protein